jgi:hypothetical protein
MTRKLFYLAMIVAILSSLCALPVGASGSTAGEVEVGRVVQYHASPVDFLWMHTYKCNYVVESKSYIGEYDGESNECARIKLGTRMYIWRVRGVGVVVSFTAPKGK